MKCGTEYTDPFRAWVIEGFCPPIDPATLPERSCAIWEACYSNDVERGKRATRRLEALPLPLQCVFTAMRDPAMVDLWRLRTDIEDLQDDPTMHGGGLHVMEPGSWLQSHLDYSQHPKLPGFERRLNLIAFLHPEWRPEWGGQLLLADASGTPVHAIEPLPGRLVAFETSDISVHGVRQLSADAPERISAAVYFIAKARPSATRTRAMFFANRNAPNCPCEVA